MQPFNRIKIRWLIPLFMTLALFRPFNGIAQDDSDFSWLQLIPPGYALDSWSFEDTNWDSDFGFPPLSFTNIQQVPDWDGNALQVDSTNTAWLTYNIVEDAPGYGEYTNLTLDTGSIEFWFIANWESADTNFYGTGPNDWGRFIDVGTWTTNADCGWWSLYLNPSGTGIYFSSSTNGVRTNYLSAPISWDSNTWHMVVLTYSPSNTFLYLDGQPAASGNGVLYIPSGDILTNGFAIGSDFATGLGQAHGQFDDLYTYNYQLSADDVADDYAEIYSELPGGFHPDDDPPLPGDGGGGSSAFIGDGYPVPYYGTNLFLTVTNALGNQASGWINNSSIFVPYTIFSRQSLPWQAWSPEATFYGSGITNFTAFSVPTLGRTNLFLRAESEIAPRIVGAGNTTFAALRRDKTVWTWGDGNYGQLGNDQWTNSSTPVQVIGLSNVVAIAEPSDGDFTLALDSNGNVWSWGTNCSGQLGRHDSLYEAESTPAVIPGLSNIVAIAGGVAHALALKSDGTVWGWGDNAYGDLGNGTDTQRDYAVQVSGLTNVIAIASGDYHGFALCANGAVFGWGYNGDWELGIGNADDQWLPVLVSNLTNAVALSGGADFSIALLANGTIQAWGANDSTFGEIGDISSSTPVPVPGLSNIVSIACGELHNLFIDTSGNLFAWGSDFWGQFGDNGDDWGSTDPYFLTTVSNVTSIAGGNSSSIISVGNGNIYTFGLSYEYESAPTLTDLYTNYSSDDNGLPDWWELKYFGHLGLNASSDPVGDGWTLLQDYEQGYNPTNFITPPAVTGLTVTQTNGQSDVTLTWSAVTPAPLDYAIYRIDYDFDTWQYGSPQEIGEVAGNVTTFTDNGSTPGGGQYSVYEVYGVYGGGTSSESQAYINATTLPTLTDNIPFTAVLIRNGTGRWQVMFSGLPIGIQTVRLLSYLSGQIHLTEDISVSNLVYNAYVIPDEDVLNYLGSTLYVEGIGPDGLPGQNIYAGVFSPDAPYFVNGQQDIEQNLIFLIRAASINHTFGYYGNFDGQTEGQLIESATNFEEFSFLHHNNVSPDGLDVLDNLWPFTENYSLANNLVNTSQTNCYVSPWGTNSFNFEPNFATNMPASPIMNTNPILQPGFGPPPIYFDNFGDVTVTDWDITLSISNIEAQSGLAPWYSVATMQLSINNLFGLPYETGYEIDQSAGAWLGDYQPFGPGDTVTPEPWTMACDAPTGIGVYASQCPPPTLDFVNCYFGPLMNTNLNETNLPPVGQQSYPLPIDDSFDVTNQTPAVIFGSVGQPMILAAWAKYSIQGSSPTKYAYLGQYFTTNAWEVGGSGNITITNAGVVSPYGEFFPTEPGPVALITMTNIDGGTQATGIVNVISLALDANHDGTIDPTWNGPDFTSPSRPYVFWCNNNFDRWNQIENPAFDEIEQDDVQLGDTSDTNQNLDPNDPDCNYVVNGNRVIPDTRDLEDFARLWVCGLTSEAASNLPAGSTVTLSWGDVGNSNPNNPTIDIFQAADPDGGIEYLTNETSAQIQIDPSYNLYVGRLAPGGSLQLSATNLANDVGGNCFIWCGVTNGTGALTLTIADANSNVLAQTTAYIQIEDIKQMYERWTVGEDGADPLLVAQLATNDLPAGVSQPFRYINPPATNTPYILLVHGWNMEPWEKDRYTETAFKRLYWQGYQGRFGDFHWPTYSSYFVDGEPTYDESEQLAWQSAEGLCYKLIDLNAQYPGNVYLMAHSMGNIVAGEALRQATQSGIGQIVNTYIAMQAAVPSHAYDTNATDRSIPTLDDWGTLDVFANYYTNGASCYFNGITGAGTLVNFFNTNDFALNAWTTDQNSKPATDGAVGYKYEAPLDEYYENYLLTELYLPGDTYTIFPRIIQARCYAVGAQLNIGGAFSTNNQVNLPSVWPPDPSGNNYRDHLWHSAEFRSDNPQRWVFWNTALARMRLNSNP